MDFLVRFAGPQLARQMQEYRAYLIGPDGHIQNRVDLVCENEDEARERVKQYLGECVVELWQLGRLIERFQRKK
jgi:hypothetical protein